MRRLALIGAWVLFCLTLYVWTFTDDAAVLLGGRP